MRKSRSGRDKRSLFKDKSGEHGRKLLYLLILAAFISLLVLLLILDNNRVIINTVTLPISGLPREYEGFTIIHLSDLHGKRFGDKQQALLRAIHSQKCNVVVMTGDMVGAGGDPEPFYELLDGLSDRRVIFIAGDADPNPIQPSQTAVDESGNPGPIDVLAPYIREAQKRKAIYLDVPYTISAGEKKIMFAYEYQLTLDVDAAISDLQNQIRSFSADEDDAETQAVRTYRLSNMIDLKNMRAQLASDDLQIILRHYPLSEVYLRDIQNGGGRPTVILAGHYNGGQWRVPFLGALHIPASDARFGGWFPSFEAGLMTSGGISQYVSAGLGVSSTSPFPLFRLFNTPEITVIQLTGFFGS